MSKIKQLLRLHQSGMSNRQIGISLDLYKETVNSYIRKLQVHRYNIEALLRMEDPVLEAKFSDGNPAYLQHKFDVFKELIPYFEKELNRKHVTRMLLWKEYREKHPDGYGYSQFCYHLSQLLIARKGHSAIIHHDPANKLYVDFAGDEMTYVNPQTGESIPVQVFVATLPFSNYTYALAVPSQSTDDFIYALTCCLKHLGGTPQILVPDNLKAAVIKADRYEPSLNKVMEDFANHYGFVVMPARSRRPKDKSNVENEVKIIYKRVYARLRNTVCFSLEELNQAIAQKVRDHNQTRMQKFEFSREEKFLAEEKSLLAPLPTTEYEIQYYAQLRVLPNNCICLARDKNHHYSVPFEYIGTKVDLVYTRTIVQIYKGGACIATHPREKGNGYTTQIEHFASTHQHHMQRSPEYYIKKSKEKSEYLPRIIEMLFEKQRIPELSFRSCDALLSLQRKVDPLIFEKACRIAFENNIYGVKRIRDIVNHCAKTADLSEPNSLPKHNNIRGKDYFS